jgi:NAD(P)H-hydrate epimerase
MTESELPALPHREPDANKGDFGRVLVIAGSRGMVGAGCLAAESALRSGAGLVRLAVPECVWDIVATKLTSVMTAGLPCTPEGTFAAAAVAPLAEMMEWATVVALGPGFGRSADAGQVVHELLPHIGVSLVIDADGLFHLATALDRLVGRQTPTVLTPHPGEMARLLKTDIPSIEEKRETVALDFARNYGVVLVLKGAGTVVSDGDRVYVNTTGNPGMATGGTGDVLTGVIAGLIAQGMGAYEAAVLGVYLHGFAGDIAARYVGMHSLIAEDLVQYLAPAFLEYRGG